MKKYLLALFVLGLAGTAFADSTTLPTTAPSTEPSTQAATEPAKAPDAAEPKHFLSLDGSIDITNAYFYRGYKQQEGGVIIQPNLTISFNIPQLQPDSGLSITPYIGTFNSTSTVSNSPKSPKWWFESDVFAGAKFDTGKWELDMYYQYNAYPGDVWVDTQEVDAVLSYDDGWFTQDKLHLPVAINPHVAIARELTHSDNILNGSPGTYGELGIAPEYDFTVLGHKIPVTLPVTTGVSFDHYYLDSSGNNQWFGYVSVGLKAEIPLSFISGKGFGDWKLVPSVTYTYINAESAVAANDGKHDSVVGMLSLGFSY